MYLKIRVTERRGERGERDRENYRKKLQKIEMNSRIRGHVT